MKDVDRDLELHATSGHETLEFACTQEQVTEIGTKKYAGHSGTGMRLRGSEQRSAASDQIISSPGVN